MTNSTPKTAHPRGAGERAGREEAAGSRLPGEAGLDTGRADELAHRLLVERVHDYAIFLMDRHGVITHWGEGAERIKEFSPEEVLGRHLSALYPPEGSEDGTAEEHLRHAAEHGEYIGEGMRRARDRGLFPARVVLTALRRNGELLGFSKVTQDLSERRQVEAQLEEARRAAEAASVEKSRFLATMSHEIRTPINAILGYTDLLELGLAGPLGDDQRQYLERVKASGRHLLALIEDVLDFARVDAGRLAVTPAEASAPEAVETALVLLRPQAEARGLRVAVDCETAAYWGDETRVQQILANLVGNAVKFTPRGGEIRLSCGAGKPGPEAELSGLGPWTFVRVADTGVGIPPDRLSSVFEPFVQVDNQLTRVHQGTGLGLAISRRLARLMGGDLVAESRVGAGSSFTLWLPGSQAAAESPGAAGGRIQGASLTRVGHHLGGAAHQVVRRFTEQLRVDPATPHARHRSRSELEDHVATLLTDLAQTLVMLEEDGQDAPATARDGEDVQALLSRRHGRQRRRLGWTEEGMAREAEILRAEIETVLRDTAAVASGDAVDEALPIVHRLLERAFAESLRAFREDGDDGGAATERE